MKILTQIGKNLHQNRTERLHRGWRLWLGKVHGNRKRNRFFQILLKTSYGKVNRFYNQWEQLPDRDSKHQLKATKLVNKFDSILKNHQRTCFNSFMVIQSKAILIKSETIKELLRKTQSKQGEFFYKWQNHLAQCKNIE